MEMWLMEDVFNEFRLFSFILYHANFSFSSYILLRLWISSA